MPEVFEKEESDYAEINPELQASEIDGPVEIVGEDEEFEVASCQNYQVDDDGQGPETVDVDADGKWNESQVTLDAAQKNQGKKLRKVLKT